MSIQVGVSYFGNRTLRHVQRDLEDMAAGGIDYVVHCFTESDLIWGLESMRQIVRLSKEVGLQVHMDPWGVAGVFGGEALSKYVTWHVDQNQVLADGSGIGVTCLNRPELRTFLHQWADAAIDLGADAILWDEPHWYPGDRWYFGEDRGERAIRWTCRCGVCQELFRTRYGHDMPVRIDDEVTDFRQQAVYDLLVDLIGYSSGRGVENILCLLPHGILFELVGVPNWEPFLQIPGLDRFGTDPYHRAGDTVPMEPYIRPNAREVRRMCDTYGRKDQFWLQGYGFPAGTEHEIGEAVQIALDEGLTNIGIWSYRACESMSKLWPADIEATWQATLAALRMAKARG